MKRKYQILCHAIKDYAFFALNCRDKIMICEEISSILDI